MPTLINGKVTYQSGESLPNVGSSAYSAAQAGQISSPTTLNSENITNSNPIPVPSTPVPTPIQTPISTIPTGTSVDANGYATVTPPAPAQDKSLYDKAIEKYGGLGDVLATKAAETAKLQESNQLAEKTQKAASSYNTYNTAKVNLAQQLERMQTAEANTSGGVGGGYTSSIRKFEREGNANLANLAIQAQADQGLLTAAEKTIKDKIDAQFEPIKEQIDYYAKFIQLNQNNLTDKEKFQLEQQATTKKTELAGITKTADDLHQSLLKNDAPPSVYSALDRITNDYISGRITAQDAQSKMYQAAGQYGTTPDTQIVKLDNGQTVVVDKKTNNIVKNLGGAKEAELQPGDNPQLYKGLSTPTATAVRSAVTKYSSEPIVQNFATIQEGYNFSKALDTKTKNPADDQALVYSLAKALDPGSVVREGEYATAQKYSQSWINAYGKGITQALAGTGFLSETARENIKKTIKQKYDSSKVGYDNQYNQTAQQINNLTGRKDGTNFLKSYVTPEGASGSGASDPLGIL